MDNGTMFEWVLAILYSCVLMLQLIAICTGTVESKRINKIIEDGRKLRDIYGK